MAATVTIRRHTGVGGSQTKTDITSGNTRASTSDAFNPGTSDPIPIPPSGSKYSYWVSTQLSADTTPAGTIDNIKWYSDGSNNFGTGVTVKGADASTGVDSGYRQAAGTPGDTGTELTQGNHTGLDSAPVDVFGLTSGSPKALGGSIVNPSTGDFGDFFVYQIAVDNTASPGELPVDETFTFKYDET
ncbi:hypothetical protein LCGC14_0856500 [marine sediment metagenome]|uniref:Uncharacterized protein n=1 Tax=marine sediment metagenome TaxID=412755 RepID=A0A0F9P8M3_9ZZZZ